MCCFANASSGQCFPYHLCRMCQLSECLCLSTHTPKKTILIFITALPILGQPLQKQLARYTNKWPFLPSNYMVYSTVLIGSRCFISADWSKSKWWFSWFVLFQSSGVLRRLNHLTELIIPPPELGKLVQSKAWLVESVVLNRIKACSLCSTPQLFLSL